jgi:hypothetical protein
VTVPTTWLLPNGDLTTHIPHALLPIRGIVAFGTRVVFAARHVRKRDIMNSSQAEFMGSSTT